MADEQTNEATVGRPHQHHAYAVPYRGRDGDPVTITVEQFHAIWHALGVWSRLCQDEGSEQADPARWHVNAYKSRALGRLLIGGKPLFASVPPRSMGAPDHDAWDAENVRAWRALDRSDWPEIQSPDFGGTDTEGNPFMIPVCPGCGLYEDNDEAPEDHFDDDGPCSWAARNGSSEEGDR